MHTSIAIQKGSTPRKMVYIGTSLAIPLMMNTLMPTGGVMRLISMTSVMMTPNQMGSKPISRTMGKTTGMVSTMMASPSIKQPRMMYASTSRARIRYLLRPASVARMES